MKVSIGLPVYNGGEYLEEALRSLLAQTCADIELIVSDNASTDGTQALCERYALRDKRICYIRQPENIGAVANFNFVLQQAKGEYFMWAGHDDRWEPTFIEQCLKALDEHHDAVMAFPAFAFLYHGEDRTLALDANLYFPFAIDLYKRLKAFIGFYLRDGKATLIYGFWRRSAIADNLFVDVSAGDASFVMRGLARGPFLFIHDTLFYKGIMPGKDYLQFKKVTASLALRSVLQNRIPRALSELSNVAFIFNVSGLSLGQKMKLAVLEGAVAARTFTHRVM